MDEMLTHKETVVTEVKAEPELIEIPELADLSTQPLPEIAEDATESSN